MDELGLFYTNDRGIVLRNLRAWLVRHMAIILFPYPTLLSRGVARTQVMQIQGWPAGSRAWQNPGLPVGTLRLRGVVVGAD